jgi:hypothetical protein
MRFIANILTDKNLSFNNLYNVVRSKEDIIDGIPTLVIGWEYTKIMYSNANILDWEIEKNLYWTYGSRERRNKYEENLERFKDLSLKQFVKSVKYVYYNILTITDEERFYIFDLIENVGASVYMSYDMLYIMDNINDKVVGISLRDIDYLGKDRKKIFAKIYSNPNNKIITLDNDVLTWDMRNVLRNYNYVIPYLFR